MDQVKHIIVVGSGKGGVGKSTVSANIAIALSQTGAKVALVDADIYGPSIPIMFGVENEKPNGIEKNGKTWILPIEKHGIKLMSIGFFVDPDKAILWRGPMVSNALKQLFTETLWDEIDYLIVDLPPGTGDIQITLSKLLEINASILVTTPQKVAIADVKKAADMFVSEGVNIPIMGIVENMAYFTPLELPDQKYYIFGKGETENLAKELNIPILAQIPLVQSVAESGDMGSPITLNDNKITNKIFNQIALSIMEKMPITKKTEVIESEETTTILMDANKKTELVEKVRAAIEKIRPFLQADGGDIAFVELTNDFIVKVQLQGACGTCPYSLMTLKNGVETAVKKEVPEIAAVESI